MLQILLGLMALIFAVAGDGDSDDSGDDSGDDDGDDKTDSGDEADLGEAGKRALKAERAERKAADKRAKAATTAMEKLQKQVDDAAAANDSEQDKAVKQAAKDATKAAATTYGARILNAEILAAAAGKLVTPADAIGLLDRTEFDPDADPDDLRASINSAIDQLLKDRPYLRADKVSGSADSGAKPKPASTDDKLTPKERIIRGYEQNKKQ
jgi:hypothetical protein